VSWFSRDNSEEAETVAREAAERLASEVGEVSSRELGGHQIAIDQAAKRAGFSKRERDIIEAEFFHAYMEQIGRGNDYPRR
jgi:hypothetical protein